MKPILVHKLKSRTPLFCFFFLSVCFSSFSQQTSSSLSGEVLSGKDAVPFAQVILRKQADSSLVAFTSADEKGVFSLTCNYGKYLLEVRSVGYLTHYDTIEIRQKKKSLDIELEEDVQALEQVEVVETAPITQSEDTLSYNAQELIGTGDEKLEDVIKKIPNLEVTREGDLYYKGKRIDDIEIEGESLFKQSPQTISRTLPADVVSKIQVVEGKSWNENPKLNIKIKEDKKNVIFGEAGLQSGSRNDSELAYRGKSNAFYINPKLKMMALADLNNVGQHLFDLRSYLSFTGQSFSSVRSQDINELPLQQTETEVSPQTQAIFGGLSAVYTISPKLKLKSFGFYNQRKESYFSSLRRRFAENSLNGIYEKTQSQEQDKDFLTGKMKLLFSPSQTQNWSTQIGFQSLLSQTDDENRVDFLSTNNQVNQQVTLNNSTWNLSTSYSNLIKEKNHFQLKATYQYEEREQDLSLDNTQDVFSPVLQTIIPGFPVPSLRRFITQINQRYNNYEIKGVFRRIVADKIFIGTNLKTEVYDHKQDFGSDKEELRTIDLLNPANTYYLQRTSGNVFLEIEKSRWSFQSRLTLANYYYDFEGKVNQKEIREFQVEPQAELRLTLPRSQRITLSYERKNQYPNAQNLNRAWQFDDFRTLRNGTDSLSQMTTDELRLSYSYMDLFNRLMVFASFSYESVSNAIAQNQFIFATADTRTDINVPSEVLTGVWYVTKSLDIGETPLSLKAQVVWNSTQSQNVLNDTRNVFTNTFTQYQLDLNTSSRGNFNISGTAQLQRINFQNSLGENIDPVNNYRFFLSPFVQLFNKLQITPSIEQRIYTSEQEDASFSFLHVKMKYPLSKSLDVKMEGYNILNTSTIDFLSVSAIYEQGSRREVLGRTAFIGLNYKF